MDEDEQRELEWLRWELQEVGEDGQPIAEEEQQQHEPSYHNSTANNTGYPQHFLHPPLPPSAHQQPAFPPFLSPHTAPCSAPGGENGTFPMYCARDVPGVPIAAPVAAHGFIPPLSNPFDRRGTEERAEPPAKQRRQASRVAALPPLRTLADHSPIGGTDTTESAASSSAAVVGGASQGPRFFSAQLSTTQTTEQIPHVAVQPSGFSLSAMPAGSAVGAESAAGVSVAMGDGEGGFGVGGGRGTSGKRKRGSPVPSPVPSLRLPELRGPEASSTGSRAGGVHQPMTVSAVSFPRGPAFPRSTAPIGSGSSLILPPYPDSKSLIRRRPDRISQPQGRSDGTRGGPSGQRGSAAQERGQPSTTPGAFNPLSNLSQPPTPQQPPSVPSSPPVAIDIDVTESGGGHWL